MVVVIFFFYLTAWGKRGQSPWLNSQVLHVLKILAAHWLKITLLGDRIRFHRFGAQSYKAVRTSEANCRSKSSPVLCPTSCRYQSPTAPNLGWISVLEWHTNSGIFYCLGGYNSGTARGKRCMGQGMETGHRAAVPSSATSLSRNTSPGTPMQKRSDSVFLGFLWTYHYRDTADQVTGQITGHGFN